MYLEIFLAPVLFGSRFLSVALCIVGISSFSSLLATSWSFKLRRCFSVVLSFSLADLFTRVIFLVFLAAFIEDFNNGNVHLRRFCVFSKILE